MAETSQDFIYVNERRLPYETFDADNHLYENQDALTKFLPPEYEGAIKYVQVGGADQARHPGSASASTSPTPRSGGWPCPGGWGNTASNRGHGGSEATPGSSPG